MVAATIQYHYRRPREILYTILPGPTRKRVPMPYCYRLAYQNPHPAMPGCALLWEVYGGRTIYQVALERAMDGKLIWHCSCADHVYRSETEPNHVCKHVRGVAGIGRQAVTE